MITIDDLRAKTATKSSSKSNVAFKLEPDLTIETIVENLENYFGKAPKQKVIRLIFEGGERRYLKRTDFMTLVNVSTRGIGAHDGATLPGRAPVKFIKLCCPNKDCNEVLWVTNYDKNAPPYCDNHTKPMKPCK